MEVNKPVSIVIILIITSALLYLFVLPKYKELKDLHIELVKKQLQYEGRTNYYSKLSGTLHNIEQNQDALDKIESALPSDVNLASTVYFLQGKARESKLAVESITFSQAGLFREEESSIQEVLNVIFKVELSGSYQGLKSFLSSLERSARLFEVNSISFSPSSANLAQRASQLYNFTMEIQAHTY